MNNKAILARVKNMGQTTADRARVEAALSRICGQMGMMPLKVRWVKNYNELKKIDGWGPSTAAFGALGTSPVTARIIDERVYNFLNPQSWAAVSGGWGGIATSAFSTTDWRRELEAGLGSIWINGSA